MYQIKITSAFKKSYKLMQKRGLDTGSHSDLLKK